MIFPIWTALLSGRVRWKSAQHWQVKKRIIFDLAAVFTWRTVQVLFKYFVKVTGIVKTNIEGQVRDRLDTGQSLLQKDSGLEDPVFDQIFYRSDLQCALEAAAAFAFAQSGVGGDIFETEFFGSMLLKIRKNVFQTL